MKRDSFQKALQISENLKKLEEALQNVKEAEDAFKKEPESVSLTANYRKKVQGLDVEDFLLLDQKHIEILLKYERKKIFDKIDQQTKLFESL